MERALEIWQRRKWIAVLVFSAVLAAAAGLALSLPDRYRASARVLVVKQEVSEEFVRRSVTAELETRIQTVRQDIMSRARLSELIDRLGLYANLRDKVPADVIVERMRRDTELDFDGVDQGPGRPGTIAFTLSYSAADPQIAAEVANTLAALFVEENSKSRAQHAARTADFLKEQLVAVKDELDAKEQRTNTYRLRHTGELPQQLEANIAALERLNTQLRLNGEHQIRVIERRDRLEEQIAEARSAPAVAPPAPPETPAAKLEAARTKLAELRGQFSERYPDVIRLKDEIAALERQIPKVQQNGHGSDGQADGTAGAEPGVRLQRSLASLDIELKSLKDQEDFLRRAIAGYEGRLENAPSRQLELQRLAGDYEATKERYESLLKRYQEAQLAENLEQDQSIAQVRVLDPAVPPREPSDPNRLRLLLLGLIASFAFAFGAIVAAEKLDTSFHNVDDLRAFVDVPTLASLRLIRTKGDIRRFRRRFVLLAFLVIVGLVLIFDGAYYFGSGRDLILPLVSR